MLLYSYEEERKKEIILKFIIKCPVKMERMVELTRKRDKRKNSHLAPTRDNLKRPLWAYCSS